MSVTVRVPVSVPVAVGVKVTLIVQEPLTATLPAQLLLSPKLALATMLAMVIAPLPVLLSVTGCDALVVPTFWLLNVRLPGETCAVRAIPVPVRLTVCAALEAEVVIDNVPVRAPVWVGVK